MRKKRNRRKRKKRSLTKTGTRMVPRELRFLRSRRRRAVAARALQLGLDGLAPQRPAQWQAPSVQTPRNSCDGQSTKPEMHNFTQVRSLTVASYVPFSSESVLVLCRMRVAPSPVQPVLTDPKILPSLQLSALLEELCKESSCRVPHPFFHGSHF